MFLIFYKGWKKSKSCLNVKMWPTLGHTRLSIWWTVESSLGYFHRPLVRLPHIESLAGRNPRCYFSRTLAYTLHFLALFFSYILYTVLVYSIQYIYTHIFGPTGLQNLPIIIFIYMNNYFLFQNLDKERGRFNTTPAGIRSPVENDHSQWKDFHF